MDRRAVERAVRLAGLSLPDGVEYEIVGQDPILPSSTISGTVPLPLGC
jgi:hypothetical protein